MDKVYTVIIINQLNNPVDIVAVKSFDNFAAAKECRQEIFDEEYLAMCEIFKCENIEKYIDDYSIQLKGTNCTEKIKIIETFL